MRDILALFRFVGFGMQVYLSSDERVLEPSVWRVNGQSLTLSLSPNTSHLYYLGYNHIISVQISVWKILQKVLRLLCTVFDGTPFSGTIVQVFVLDYFSIMEANWKVYIFRLEKNTWWLFCGNFSKFWWWSLDQFFDI